MPRKRPLPIDLLRRRFIKHQASVANHRPMNHVADDLSAIPELETRLQLILDIAKSPTRKASDMIFFVMYDITSNKVRRTVVKYLLRMGCHRVQRSIFLADLPAEKCVQIRQDLKEVQAMYDNEDSVFIVPLSVDYVKSMHVIGRNVDFDMILRLKNTLFF